MGCKITITFKNSHCEGSSAQLIFEREKVFFLQKLSYRKDLKLQNYLKDIAGTCWRTPLPASAASWVCILLAVAGDQNSR